VLLAIAGGTSLIVLSANYTGAREVISGLSSPRRGW
jgi:hypothetical protein